MDIETHWQTLLVRDAIFSCLSNDQRGQVVIGRPGRRRTGATSCGHVVVENFDTICVSDLSRLLPSKSRVFSRAPIAGGGAVTLTRLEIYYPVESYIWHWKCAVLCVSWIVVPLIGATCLVLST
jgi:hypothetical protein